MPKHTDCDKKADIAPAAAPKTATLPALDESCLIKRKRTIYYTVHNIHRFHDQTIDSENQPISYDPLKLHAYFHIDHLERVHYKIHQLSKKAAIDSVIHGFKSLMKEVLLTSKYRNNWRAQHMVYTFYLPVKFDPKKTPELAHFVLACEIILKEAKIPKVDFSKLGRSEIPFSDYFIFRATNTAANMAAGVKQYIPAASSTDPQTLATLEETGRNDEQYRYLAAFMAQLRESPTAALSQHVANGKSPLSAASPKKDEAKKDMKIAAVAHAAETPKAKK